jgi:glycosyltransferase involved in cell wall biosynthesis
VVRKLIYIPGDWLAGSKTSNGIWSHIGSNIVFPSFDYLACRASDITLNCSESLKESRYNFWHRKITQREEVYTSRLKIKASLAGAYLNRNKLVFLGNVRNDSGLPLVLKCLKILYEKNGITLKIIGIFNEENLYLQKLAKELQCEKYVEFTGFIEREDFENEFSDCFCGINLLSSGESYTSKTICAKIYDYFQYLLPVIATSNTGVMGDVIRENNLGLIIELADENIIEAVRKIHNEQIKYRESIMAYVRSFQGTDITEFFQ